MKRDEPKPGMPFANSAIARYLDKQIDALHGVKTQRQIATEIGYDKPNMISMFKRGESRVPLDKIPLLAKALHVEPMHLFRLALEQYWPDMAEMITTMFGRVATQNEEELFLTPWREATKDLDPAITEKMKTIVQAAIAKTATVAEKTATVADKADGSVSRASSNPA